MFCWNTKGLKSVHVAFVADVVFYLNLAGVKHYLDNIFYGPWNELKCAAGYKRSLVTTALKYFNISFLSLIHVFFSFKYEGSVF